MVILINSFKKKKKQQNKHINREKINKYKTKNKITMAQRILEREKIIV